MTVKHAAELALKEQLTSLGVKLDHDSRAEHAREVVVETIGDAALLQTQSDLGEGSGGELSVSGTHRPKFHSAFSSCALAVNVFGFWRLDPSTLVLDDTSGFTALRFEAQRPIFASGATPPNLDVLAETDDQVVAVESKLTEYLGGNERASFADRYYDAVADLAHESWRDLHALLKREPTHFHFLNANQLVKHYLGLKRAQQTDGRPVTLSYLYWEPTNTDSYPAWQHHRAEADEFSKLAADPLITFKHHSYTDLWAQWDVSKDAHLREHVRRLRERYELPVQVDGKA